MRRALLFLLFLFMMSGFVTRGQSTYTVNFYVDMNTVLQQYADFKDSVFVDIYRIYSYSPLYSVKLTDPDSDGIYTGSLACDSAKYNYLYRTKGDYNLEEFSNVYYRRLMNVNANMTYHDVWDSLTRYSFKLHVFDRAGQPLSWAHGSVRTPVASYYANAGDDGYLDFGKVDNSTAQIAVEEYLYFDADIDRDTVLPVNTDYYPNIKVLLHGDTSIINNNYQYFALVNLATNSLYRTEMVKSNSVIFKGVEYGQYLVQVSGCGIKMAKDTVTLTESSGSQLVELDVDTAGKKRVDIYFVDRNGNPVPNVAYVIFACNSFRGVSDKNGHVRVITYPGELYLETYNLSSGYNDTSFSFESDTTVYIPMDVIRPCLVYCHTEDGEPVPGYLLYTDFTYTQTDSNGTAIVGYWNDIELYGWSDRNFYSLVDTSLDKCPANDTIDLTLTKKTPGTIVIRVHDPSGKPVPGAKVYFEDFWDVFTDSTGTVSEEFGYGYYKYTISKDGYFSKSRIIYLNSDTLVVQDTLLPMEYTHVIFKVVDTSGEPVTGARIELSAQHDNYDFSKYYYLYTDKQGVVDTFVLSYQYDCYVNKEYYTSLDSSIEISGDSADFLFTLTRFPSVKVVVYVHDSLPIDSAEIYADWINRTYYTDSMGYAAVDIPYGDGTTVQIRAKNYPYTKEVWVGDYYDTVDVEFIDMKPAYIKTVCDGQPVPGVRIYFNYGNSWVVTDSNGMVELYTYGYMDLQFVNTGYFLLDTSLYFEQGDTAVVNLVRKEYLTVRVRVLDSVTLSPVPNLKVDIEGFNRYDTWLIITDSARTDSNGYFTYNGLKYTDYSFEMSKKDYYVKYLDIKLTDSVDTVAYLKPYPDVAFYVTNGIIPLQNTKITQDFSLVKYTGSDGMALFKLPLNSVYEGLFQIEHPGYAALAYYEFYIFADTLGILLEPAIYSDVTVKVLNGSQPLSGASVAIQGFDTLVTGGDGTIETQLPYGDYAVTVSNQECGQKAFDLAVNSVQTEVTVILCQNTPVIDQPSILVYPNPTYGEVIIENARGYYVKVTNVSGKVVRSFLVKDSKATVDLSGLPQGVYMITLVNAEGQATVKVLKY